MKKNEIVIIADYSESEPMTLEELIEVTRSTPDFIQDLIEFGILSDEEEYDLTQLNRIKTVQHLQRDLEINMAGAAMVIDLLDQMEEMRARLEMLEKLLM
jgi:chaperone modulatory protein CbpM